MRKIKLLLFSLLALVTTHAQTLSYKVGVLGNIHNNTFTEINGYITSSQQSVVAKFESNIYVSGNWTADANYDYYVNNTLVGSSTNPSLTVNLSAYIPITSVKIVSKPRNVFDAATTVGITLTVTPTVTLTSGPTVSNVSYIKYSTASPLSATLTGSNVSLKWYTSSLGENYSSTPPTPSTATVGTTTYYVAQANSSGVESARSAITVTINPVPAPSIFYWSTNLYTVGTEIMNLTPLNFGGAVPGSGSYIYSVSPALPTGLSINATTGIISGTPTQVTAATNYTITAVNEGGSSSAVVNIRVKAQAPNISYASPQLYTVGTAITNFAPTNTGGAVPGTSTYIYSVSPALPSGLSINATTGVISGTPTQVTAATDYTIIATNESGSSSAIVNIRVKDKAPNISYATPQLYTVGTAISTLTPTNSGGSVPGISTYIYTVNPSLPAGLTISAATGAITGTPTEIKAATNYTITATNESGSNQAVLNIRVKVQAPAISYNTPNEFTVGTVISSLTPTNTGGSITLSTKVSTFAGTGDSGNQIGSNLSSVFNYPFGVAAHSSGIMYVSDMTNHSIRLISNGNVIAVAGNGSAGSQDGTGTGASFDNPMGIAVDAAGYAYVADGNNHKIRKVSPFGIVTTLAGSGTAGFADGQGAAASFNSPTGVAVDTAGNVYVADMSNHRIRKITPLGLVSTFAGSSTEGSADGIGSAASFKYPAGVATDAYGNIYVADFMDHKIRKITADGNVTTLAGSGTSGFADGTGAASSFSYPSGVATDYIGNVYVADKQNNRIRKISKTGVVTTLAGSETAGTVDGDISEASFNAPTAVSVDMLGNVYVADQQNHKIRKISSYGYYISPALPAGLNFDTSNGIISGTPTDPQVAKDYTITGTNETGSSSVTISIKVNGAAPNISYSTPQTFTSGSAVNVVLPTNIGGAVPTSGSDVSVLAGGTYGTANGTGAQAQFSYPYGIATDAAGNVYVADQYTHSIRKITPAGIVTTLAGSGSPFVADGTGAAAGFNTPTGVAVDANGNVFVAEQYSNTIRKVTADGVTTTFAGSGLQGLTDDTGIAAQFNQPIGVAVDATGNVYVADFMNNAIRKITPAGVVTTLAGGTQGAANGTGTEASFNAPTGLAVDAEGNVFVADQVNNLIRKITPAGVVTTFAGNAAENAYNDGIGTAASFNYPTSITMDASGNMYVADQYNYRIRKITPDAVVTTIAGDGTDGFANGLGLTAKFSSPVGVSLDGSGNLYVSDFFNNSIRKIVLFGYSISPKLPAGLTFNTATGAITGTPTEEIPATNFTITATNEYGTHSTVISISVTTQVSVSIENANDKAVKVYATADRKIVIAGAENAEVTVFNQIGQQVFNAKVNETIKRSFVPGVYIVRVNNIVRKVILR